MSATTHARTHRLSTVNKKNRRKCPKCGELAMHLPGTAPRLYACRCGCTFA